MSLTPLALRVNQQTSEETPKMPQLFAAANEKLPTSPAKNQNSNLEQIITDLNGDTFAGRNRASASLKQIIDYGSLQDFLRIVDQLDSPQAEVRLRILKAANLLDISVSRLERLLPTIKEDEARQLLEKTEKYPDLRLRIIEALGVAGDVSVPLLIPLLKNPDRIELLEDRGLCAIAVTSLGKSGSKEAAAKLAELAKIDDLPGEFCIRLCKSLTNIGKLELETLEKLLTSPNAYRFTDLAVEQAAKYIDHTDPIIRMLLDPTKFDSSSASNNLTDLVKRLGKQLVPYIVEEIGRNNLSTLQRERYIGQLKLFEPEAIISTLKQQIDASTNITTRCRYLLALRTIDSDQMEQYIPQLIESLEKESQSMWLQQSNLPNRNLITEEPSPEYILATEGMKAAEKLVRAIEFQPEKRKTAMGIIGQMDLWSRLRVSLQVLHLKDCREQAKAMILIDYKFLPDWEYYLGAVSEENEQMSVNAMSLTVSLLDRYQRHPEFSKVEAVIPKIQRVFTYYSPYQSLAAANQLLNLAANPNYEDYIKDVNVEELRSFINGFLADTQHRKFNSEALKLFVTAYATHLKKDPTDILIAYGKRVGLQDSVKALLSEPEVMSCLRKINEDSSSQ